MRLRWSDTPRIALTLVAVLLAMACHTMRFEVDRGPVEREIYHRKYFYFWGLTPTRRINVTDYCKQGAVSVREEITFSDGLLNFITLGIVSPRSSWYYCAPAPENQP
jgi:hypothetical protein